MGLALLANSHMPLKFWDEAFLTATYLINLLPSRVINYETPVERLFKCKPDYTLLRVLGCAVWPNLRPYNSRKLNFRSTRCVFLGYSSKHKGFKCLEPNSGRVYISRDVTFDESIFPFADLHPNAGALLRCEILLLPDYSVASGDVGCSNPVSTNPNDAYEVLQEHTDQVQVPLEFCSASPSSSVLHQVPTPPTDPAPTDDPVTESQEDLPAVSGTGSQADPRIAPAAAGASALSCRVEGPRFSSRPRLPPPLQSRHLSRIPRRLLPTPCLRGSARLRVPLRRLDQVRLHMLNLLLDQEQGYKVQLSSLKNFMMGP